jgi:hypothetical protein
MFEFLGIMFSVSRETAIEDGLERLLVKRQGSYLYTRAYRKLVLVAEAVYVALGAALALIAANAFDSWLAGGLLLAALIIIVALIWIGYKAILWVFMRESRQSVDITDEGILELVDGRERSFIPWGGIIEIELDATVLAGGTLRVRTNFSEIAISNMDLVIKEDMTLGEMNAAIGQAGPMRELLAELKSRAPQAALKMNKLAKRRYKGVWSLES